MKINLYSFSITIKTKNILFLMLFLFSFCNSLIAQLTTVFSDDFNRSTVSPATNPTLYTATPLTGTINITVVSGTDNALNLVGGGTIDRQYVTAPLTNFSSPFNPILSANPGIITWSFNMKVSKSLSNTAGSVASPNNMSIVVLAASGSDLNATTTSGYIVQLKGNSGQNGLGNLVSLNKFSGGLVSASITSTALDTSLYISNFTNWVSVKVSYNPSGNVWTFFVRDDGLTPADPSNLISSPLASSLGTRVVNSTFTGNTFTHFGFFWTHGGTSAASTFACYDNFKVETEVSSLNLTSVPLSPFPNTTINTSSTPQSFRISGANLGSVFTVTAPLSFDISNGNGIWGQSATYNTNAGVLIDTAVYVRFSPNGNGTLSGNITFSRTSNTVAVSGYLDKFYYCGNGGTSSAQGLNVLSNWRAIPQSTSGPTIPSDFAHEGVQYIIKNLLGTMPLAVSPGAGAIPGWTVSGNGSKIILGSPTDHGIILTISSTKAIITTAPVVLDIDNALAGEKNVVLLQNAIIPRFGNLVDSSEVHCQSSSVDLSASTTFGKLFVDVTPGSVSFSAGNLTIKSLFQIDLPSTMNIPSSLDPYFTFNPGSKAVINGTFKFNRAQGFSSSNIAPNVNGCMLQFAGTENITLGPGSLIEYGRTNISSYSTQIVSPRSDYKRVRLSGLNTEKLFTGPTTISDTLFITTTGRSPINLGGSTTIGVLNSTDTLNINANTLTINAAITGTGLLSGSPSSNLTLNGAAGIINFSEGAKILKDFKLGRSASADLSDTLVITAGSNPGSITVDSFAVLNTNDKMILKSDSLGTSRVGISNGTIFGNVTVERYISGWRAWRFLSMPTKHNLQTIHEAWQENQPSNNTSLSSYGIQITKDSANWSSTGFDSQSPGGPSIKTYSGIGWIGIPSTIDVPNFSNGHFELGKAYMTFYRGDRTVNSYIPSQITLPSILREKGEIYIGDLSIDVPSGQFVAIGNPYASSIDFLLTDRTNIDLGYNLWDPKLGSLGGYQAILGNNCAPCGGSYNNDSTLHTTLHPYIESGQGFFVHNISASPGTIKINEQSKTNGSFLVTRNNDFTIELRTNLYKINNGNLALYDGVLNLFDTNNSNDVDGMDALKMNNFGENLGIGRNDKLLSIESRSTLQETDTIFYKLNQLKIASYQLEFTPHNIETNNLQAFLEDNYLNTRFPVSLNEGSRVAFSVTNDAGSYSSNRFRMVFNQLMPLPVTFIDVKAILQNKTVKINWVVANQTNIKEYRIERSINGVEYLQIGTTVANSNTLQNSYEFIDDNPVNGANFYRIRTVENDGSGKLSKVVMVKIQNATPEFIISPNPVGQNNEIHLKVNELPSGDYTCILYDKSGKKIESKKWHHETRELEILWKISSVLPHGNYSLCISNIDIKICESVLIK